MGPTKEQLEEFERDGYFIQRALISSRTAAEVRGVIRDRIMSPTPDVSADSDPMHAMGDSAGARAARFRKLSGLGLRSALIWEEIYANPRLLSLAQHFLGDDVLLKYNSIFVKPARTGSATPWHQDNGLWCDGETRPFNFWMAIDPATRFNGCLQFVPGSHRGEIVPHIRYADSVHPELPREQVDSMLKTKAAVQVELQPGDIVCWHSSLWHYSPPNTSDEGRIGIAGVYSSPDIVRGSAHRAGAPQRAVKGSMKWVVKAGKIAAFPPETCEFDFSRPASQPAAGSVALF